MGLSDRGVKTKLLGSILIFLGSLNSMLAWRGGFAIEHFSIAMIVVGLAVVILGAIRGQQINTINTNENSTNEQRTFKS